MYVTDATPEPLRANRIHTPGAEAWFARSHASHSEAEANESVSSGRPAVGTARRLRRDVLEADLRDVRAREPRPRRHRDRPRGLPAGGRGARRTDLGAAVARRRQR